MSAGMRTIGLLCAVVGALAVISDAAATTAYVGRGTAATEGSALDAWIGGRGGAWVEDVPSTRLASGAGSIPLTYAGMTLRATANMGGLSVANALHMFATNAGTLSGPQVVSAKALRNITLSNFSPSITAFGFYLENGANAQAANVTITMTDSNGTSTIVIGKGGDVTFGGTNPASATVLSTNNRVYRLDGPAASNPAANTAEFIGFSDLSGLTSIAINAGGSNAMKLELGDFFSSTAPASEPASLALLGVALCGLGWVRLKRGMCRHSLARGDA